MAVTEQLPFVLFAQPVAVGLHPVGQGKGLSPAPTPAFSPGTFPRRSSGADTAGWVLGANSCGVKHPPHVPKHLSFLNAAFGEALEAAWG